MSCSLSYYQTHNTYDVTFFGDSVFTILTWDPTIVSQWISGVEVAYRRQIDGGHLIVGLDVEWRPSFQRHVTNPAATLQLCVGRRCLIFQLIHSPSVPPSLVAFLANPRHTFVGIGIAEDLKKLQKDYRFGFNTNPVDLRELAAERYGRRDLKNAGLKSLTALVLGKEVEKPKNVTMSRWDNPWLTPTQVRYACVDAFVCFEIGRVLNASSPSTVGAAVSARGVRNSNDSSPSTVGYAVSARGVRISNDSSPSTVGYAVSARGVRISNDSSPSTVGAAVSARGVGDSNDSSPSTVGYAVSARGVRISNDSSPSSVGYAVSARGVRDSNDSSPSTVGYAVSAWAVRDSNDSSPSTVGYAASAWAV